ncbi:MAG: hypothetical protein MZV64_49460 [Ignavibacteriales bacterium]|nr:hypothetical protein [Ignavibacteriales bacterium]
MKKRSTDILATASGISVALGHEGRNVGEPPGTRFPERRTACRILSRRTPRRGVTAARRAGRRARPSCSYRRI